MTRFVIRSAFGAVLLLCLAAPNGVAGTIAIFNVIVDTSSIAGDTGYVDFQFNPGLPPVDGATATISGFTLDGGGSLQGVPVLTGDVAGALPQISLSNTASFNDYFQQIVFGTSLQFQVAYSTLVSGLGAGGTAFTFALLDSTQEVALLSTDSSGNLITQGIDVNGAVTTQDFSAGAANITAAPVPEPGTLVLLALGLLVGPVVRRVRR